MVTIRRDLQMKRRIYYHDTDAGGVVYYANYLKFMEEARIEFFTQRGLSVTEHNGKVLFYPVKECSIQYKKPARFADEIECGAQVIDLSKATITFLQQVKNAQTGLVLVEAKVTLVCVNEQFRPMPIPEDVRRQFA